MTSRATSASGSSKQPASGRLPPRISGKAAVPAPRPLPKVLSYPKMHSLDKFLPLVKDRLCYVIRDYGNIGISVLIVRDQKRDKITVLCGDWYGNNLDLDSNASDPLVQASLVFVNEDLQLFIKIMQTIRVDQAQFFLAIDNGQLVLTDIQVSVNKLAGPGMIRDIFGNIYRTQEVLKIETLDDRAIEYLEKGTGNYGGDLVIKPSRFTTFSPGNDDDIAPLYIRITR